MANEIIKNGIIGTLESLVEMIANVTESNGPVHQLDIDLLQEQIRKLYREVQQLDESNRKQMHESMQISRQPSPEPVVEPVQEKPAEIIMEPKLEEIIIPPVVTNFEPVEQPVIEPAVNTPEPVIEKTVEPVVSFVEPVAEPISEPIQTTPEPQPIIENIQPEPVAVEKPAPASDKNVNGDLFSQPVTLAEKLKKEDNSINQQMMGNNMLRNEKLTAAPISNLRTSIGINDKFMFVNELFKGEMKEYDAVLGLVNDAFSEEEALTILYQNLQKQGTVEKADARGKLEKYIQRRFLK